jgi:hypothetical protein
MTVQLLVTSADKIFLPNHHRLHYGREGHRLALIQQLRKRWHWSWQESKTKA